MALTRSSPKHLKHRSVKNAVILKVLNCTVNALSVVEYALYKFTLYLLTY